VRFRLLFAMPMVVASDVPDAPQLAKRVPLRRRWHKNCSVYVVYRVIDKAVLFLPPAAVEPEARKQIENTASMPFIYKHVAVMPDCHFGKGATVGTVLATRGAIIPAAVGVDIGCGMVAVKTPLKRDALTDLAALRAGIERRIPMSVARSNNKIAGTAAPRIAHLEHLAKTRLLRHSRRLEAPIGNARRRQSLHRAGCG
jgi:hypothetical protein